jgi:rhodanese-related sulfurtransferase
MRTLRRIVLIGLISMLTGIVVNQLSDQGIRFRMLMLSLPGRSGWNHFATTTADSAFFCFLEGSHIFVDVRTEKDFNIDHVPDALSLPFRSFFNTPSLFEDQDRSAAYILYDAEINSRSVRLVGLQLQKMGFKQILILRGGFIEWLDRTFPVEGGKE